MVSGFQRSHPLNGCHRAAESTVHRGRRRGHGLRSLATAERLPLAAGGGRSEALIEALVGSSTDVMRRLQYKLEVLLISVIGAYMHAQSREARCSVIR